MIARMVRSGLVIATLVVLAALLVVAAGCGDDTATTTSTVAATDSPTAQTPDDSTATTSEGSTSDSTLVSGGKSLDEYRAEVPGLEEAIEADPTDLYSLEKLAVAHYQLKEYEQAEEAYLKILAINEDAFTRNNLGNVYRDWGKTEEAKVTYRQAIDDDPTLKYPYVNLAGILQKEGDVEGAMALLEEGAKHMNEEDMSMIEAAEDRLTTTTTAP